VGCAISERPSRPGQRQQFQAQIGVFAARQAQVAGRRRRRDARCQQRLHRRLHRLYPPLTQQQAVAAAQQRFHRGIGMQQLALRTDDGRGLRQRVQHRGVHGAGFGAVQADRHLQRACHVPAQALEGPHLGGAEGLQLGCAHQRDVGDDAAFGQQRVADGVLEALRLHPVVVVGRAVQRAAPAQHAVEPLVGAHDAGPVQLPRHADPRVVGREVQLVEIAHPARLDARQADRLDAVRLHVQQVEGLRLRREGAAHRLHHLVPGLRLQRRAVDRVGQVFVEVSGTVHGLRRLGAAA
jgi:hypothetical protein